MKQQMCCCPENEMLVDGMLVDTYGGDYTFQDVFRCRECKVIYIRYYGAKPSFETLYEGDEMWEEYWFLG